MKDEGSTLGRFFYWKICKQNHRLADICTRGTIGLLLTLNMLSIPLLKGNWLVYILAGLGIILTEALVSWRALGQIVVNMGKKTVYLLWSDIINYGLIGAMFYIMIKF